MIFGLVLLSCFFGRALSIPTYGTFPFHIFAFQCRHSDASIGYNHLFNDHQRQVETKLLSHPVEGSWSRWRDEW